MGCPRVPANQRSNRLFHAPAAAIAAHHARDKRRMYTDLLGNVLLLHAQAAQIVSKVNHLIYAENARSVVHEQFALLVRG